VAEREVEEEGERKGLEADLTPAAATGGGGGGAGISSGDAEQSRWVMRAGRRKTTTPRPTC
jgi:hypothetical protein